MNTIHKYPLEITDRQTITIPNGYQIAHIGLDPQGDPCIWAAVNTDRSRIPIEVFIVGTGNPIPKNIENRHIGSFVQAPFVWHVFLGF